MRNNSFQIVPFFSVLLIVGLSVFGCKNNTLDPGEGREGVIISPIFINFRTITENTTAIVKISSYEPTSVIISDVIINDPGVSLPFIETPDTLKPNSVLLGELEFDYDLFDGADTIKVVLKFQNNPIQDSVSIRILGPSKVIHRQVLDNNFNDIPVEFNPDASKILFTSDRETQSQVFTVDRISKQIEKINQQAGNFIATGYVNDGSVIQYYTMIDTSTTIYWYDVQSKTETIQLRNFGNTIPVAVSSDGRYILLNRKIGTTHYIYLLDRSENKMIPLVISDFDDQAVLFEPGNQRVLFYRLVSGMRQMYKIRIDGTDMRKISDGLGDDIPVVATPDREYIVFYSDRVGRREVYLTDWDGSEIFQITDNLRLDNPVDVSAEYKRILYRSVINGNAQIYEAGFGGENELSYTAPDEFANEPVQYSLDGRFILYYKKKLNPQIFYVDLTTIRR